MKMTCYKVRDIINMHEQLALATFDHPDVPMEVIDEAGVRFKTTARATLLTWYGFKMHRSFPALRAYQRHFFNEEIVNTDTQLSVYKFLLWDTWEAIGGVMAPTQLSEFIFSIHNDLYNMHVKYMSAHLTTLNAIDFKEVCMDPESVENYNRLEPTEDSIAEGYKEQLGIMGRLKSRMPFNNLVRSFKASILKSQQLLQNIFCRGFLTDGDSNIFPNPIMGSYFRGLGKMEDVLKESRSATKALLMTYEPVQQTEYFTRRIQLLASSITTLLRGTGTVLYDCSHTHEYKTIPFTVDEFTIQNLEGCYYEADGELRVINQSVIDAGTLNNKTIQLRSPLGCGHRHEGKVCGTCMGQVSWSLEVTDNLGDLSTRVLCPVVTQNVISTKHVDESAKGTKLTVSAQMADFLTVNANTSTYGISKLAREYGYMRIPRTSMPYPSDLLVEDESNVKVNPLRFSTLKQVFLDVSSDGSGSVSQKRMKVGLGNTPSHFTREFMDHLKAHPPEVTAKGDFVVSLKEWDCRKPVFGFARKHRNTLDYLNEISGMLESTGSYSKLSDYKTEAEALRAFSDLAYSKFDLNISHLAVLVLSTAIKDPFKGDFNIPKVTEEIYFGKHDKIVTAGSASAKLAYEKQIEYLHSPQSYMRGDRRTCAMDLIIR